MLGQFTNGVGTICIMLLAGVALRFMFHWNKTYYSDKPVTMVDYVYKIARITGKSEYDVFLKSAEEWPIAKEKIDEDFKAYLMQQSAPYYVRDFVRRNKQHIDELHIPRY
jgi:hypothetical protein